MDSNPEILIRPYESGDVLRLLEAVLESKEHLQPWLPWCHAGYGEVDARSWVEQQVISFATDKEYAFVITNSEGEFIGGCGLNKIDLHEKSANLGYWVRSSRLRQGVASKAARLLAAWTFACTPLERLEIVVSVENEASLRTALKAGATAEGTLRHRLRLGERFHDARIFSILRGDLAPKAERT